MKLTLAEIAEYSGGRLDGPAGDVRATGYSIDTRTTAVGDVFFAIRGPRFDGHAFLAAARAAGAVAAVVNGDFDGSDPDLPCIRVESPTRALGRLASAVRQRWGGRVVGVTGSIGKTTTRGLISALLGTRYRVLETRGNFNNELGLPLSILGVGEEHDRMVLEMGMSAPGEIEALARIAGPNDGVVTNVNAVHLEFFSSIEAIAGAKAELVAGLVAGPDGGPRAFLNADDPRVRAMARGFGGEVVTWGAAGDADCRIVHIGDAGLDGTSFTIRYEGRDLDLRTPLPGRHSVSNAAAALSVALTHGVGREAAQEVVAHFRSAGRRGVTRRYAGGFLVVDDSYNSSPAALQSMTRWVGGLSGFRRRILVAGEMLELGADASALHAACGRVAAEAGMDLIIGVGGEARALLGGAGQAGLEPRQLLYADTADAASALLLERVGEGDVVLVKGSRGVGLEAVSQALGSAFEVVEG